MDEKHGTIGWNELMTTNAEAAKSYYGAICGWNFEPMPGGGGYLLAMKNGAPVAGMFEISGKDMPDWMPKGWLTYLHVADVDKAVEQSTAEGGKVCKAPWDIPGVGRIAIVTDPAGASLGLMTGESGTRS